MKTLYLLRHGALQGDSASRFIGQIDLPLSCEGVAQAKAQAAALDGRGIGMIHCSDLIRCQSTAGILARVLRTPVRAHYALREVSMGAWEGLQRREIAERWAAEFEARGRDIADYRPPAGESFADCLSRTLPVWQSILASAHENIVIVGHAGLNRALLCHIQERALAELFQITQDYGCINLIEYHVGQSRVRLINARPADLMARAIK